ncbi:hypothetical protein FOZ63_017684 [Perkinsus olseni]|uniref:Uncharacterized protein n=1 Tax=Perkinsus olseni TaxID=32597 RepID=A0A7J6QXE8_PEROL|nr:hypothetical protein FOZ63_017684 [Perkinsus olseni]
MSPRRYLMAHETPVRRMLQAEDLMSLRRRLSRRISQEDFLRKWYYTSGWYAGVCCVDDHRIDDVEYTKTILERENKNNLPVYGYGYRAVAVNGVLALEPGLQGSFDTCDDIYNDANFGPKSPVPRVASLHCIDDETKFPRTNRDIRRWAGRLGCARKETTKTKLNEEMTLKEWKTDEFDPARWAVDFFLGLN